jgi:putative ABC transport system permease protein
MKYLRLVWAGVWRKRTRTIFTLASIMVAFILFGILSGVDAGFAHSLETARLDRLLTDARLGFRAYMPLTYADQIARVPGVSVVAPRWGLFGYYQDPKNFIQVIGTDARFFSLRPEIIITENQLQTLLHTRTGAVVGTYLVNKYGWKVGDKIPIQSSTLHADGSRIWTFDIVAIVGDADYPDQAGWFIANYDYLDQGRATDKGTVDRFLVRVKDPGRGTQISREIDGMFANSPAPTRTNSEKSRAQSGAQFIGDVNFFIDAVVGAVFFMLLFLTGNTMMQSIRERIPEFAVLKTVGFSDNGVLYLVIAESILLSVLGALAGLLSSRAVIPITKHAMSNFSLLLQMPWMGLLRGFVLALIVALASGLIPAWRVKRLSIVDALMGR